MDLVDEEDVVLLEVCQDCGEVAGSLEDRAGGAGDADTQLLRDDVGERRLAQARRSGEEDVVEVLPPLLGRLDKEGQPFDDGALADEFGERARAQTRLECTLLLGGGGGVEHLVSSVGHSVQSSRSAPRMSSSSGCSAGSLMRAIADSAAAR